jgi:hypothetical protein
MALGFALLIPGYMLRALRDAYLMPDCLQFNFDGRIV